MFFFKCDILQIPFFLLGCLMKCVSEQAEQAEQGRQSGQDRAPRGLIQDTIMSAWKNNGKMYIFFLLLLIFFEL